MKPIKVTCGFCERVFTVTHPSLQGARDLVSVTLECHHCKAELVFDPDEIRMIPVSQLMARRLGIKLVPDDVHTIDASAMRPDIRPPH